MLDVFINMRNDQLFYAFFGKCWKGSHKLYKLVIKKYICSVFVFLQCIWKFITSDKANLIYWSQICSVYSSYVSIMDTCTVVTKPLFCTLTYVAIMLIHTCCTILTGWGVAIIHIWKHIYRLMWKLLFSVIGTQNE